MSNVKFVLRQKWTDEEIQFVIDKQKEGLSSGVIAKIMNELGMRSDCAPVTRNAVVGVWDRHRDKITKESDLPSKTRLKKKKKEEPKNFTGLVILPNLHIEERMNELFVPNSGPVKMTLENIKDRCCRFPFNDPRTDDFYYCGEPIDYNLGRSYCRFHYEICYQPPENRR